MRGLPSMKTSMSARRRREERKPRSSLWLRPNIISTMDGGLRLAGRKLSLTSTVLSPEARRGLVPPSRYLLPPILKPVSLPLSPLRSALAKASPLGFKSPPREHTRKFAYPGSGARSPEPSKLHQFLLPVSLAAKSTLRQMKGRKYRAIKHRSQSSVGMAPTLAELSKKPGVWLYVATKSQRNSPTPLGETNELPM